YHKPPVPDLGVRRNWNRATATERRQKRALRRDRQQRWPVDDRREQRARGSLVTALHRQRALPRRGQHLVQRELLTNFIPAPQAFQPRQRKYDGVIGAIRRQRLAHARIDIATDIDEAQVGPPHEQLRRPSPAACTDRSARGQGFQRVACPADERVVWVATLWDRADDESLALVGGQVFQAVDGEIDCAIAE